MKRYVQIVDDETFLAVETLDVTKKSITECAKIVDGIEINLNHERYSVYYTTEDNKYEESK